MSSCSVNQPREILIGRLAANALEILAAEFAEIVLQGYVRPCLDDELEAFGAGAAEKIPALCRELIGQIRAYEDYDHRRQEDLRDIDDIPF
jgi:hypothetical protein